MVETISLDSQRWSDVPSDIIIRSRIKYGGRKAACKGLLLEYSKNTTIHGIRYLFEVHRPIYEKIYWIVILVSSLYIAVSLMWYTFLKWQDSPVIIGFDETLVPVERIPFPTITICPEIKMDRNMFDFANVSRKIWEEVEANGVFHNNANLTDEKMSQFAASLHICDADVVNKFAKYIPKDIALDVAETLVELSVSKNETAPACSWNGRYYLCENIINFVATDEGICYQFNGLKTEDIYRDPRYVSYYDETIIDFNNVMIGEKKLNNITGNWSLEDGYIGNGYSAYPQRTVFASASRGLFAFLQGFGHNVDYSCRFKQGYKVFLNSPESVPLTTGNYIQVPHGYEVQLSVLPQYIISAKNLHELTPEKRQCYFNDERYLRFFRSYSQSNCQVECLANYTISHCGCAKFWMPKPLDVPVCKLSDYGCYNEAEENLNRMLHHQTMQRIVDPSVEISCNCMPACTSLDYNFEISKARYDLNSLLLVLRENYEHPDFLGSRLMVYFKERQFTAIKRTVVFSISTLIANCGGIFGLFMGISSLSIIEVIYFFSVRLMGNLRKRRLTQKKLTESIDIE